MMKFLLSVVGLGLVLLVSGRARLSIAHRPYLYLHGEP